MKSIVLAILTLFAPFLSQVQSQIQLIDLDKDAKRQVIVDREPGQYLGHPTTCVLDDGKTMLCVYPKGHGRGAIVYKRSTDGGLTWSDRLPTPESWATSKEVPTLHRVIDADGKKRIIMWSGLYPARLAVTEDDGANWGELKPVGDWGGIVVMGAVIDLQTGPGHYMAFFHDDGRFFSAEAKQEAPPVFNLYTTTSTDGGLTWSDPKSIYASSVVHLCEPGTVRSPDGKQIAVLLRENARRKNSHIIFSNDEGKTWTPPREVPDALNGDRHTAKYTADGRLFISFRCNVPKDKSSDYKGDWVGWVGTYEDLAGGNPGQYLVRLKDNHKGADCAYPGVEVLPDDTIVTTTYGHWDAGEEPYVLSVRLKMSELDALAEAGEASVRPGINEKFLDPKLNVAEWMERFEVESREVYSARKEVLAATGIRQGDKVADIGAGTGLYSRLFADTAGVDGGVYAVDINPRWLEHISHSVDPGPVHATITPVLCRERSVSLPPRSIDVAFTCDTYHHFEYPQSSLASILSALRPGGTFLVVDFERIPGVSSEWTLGHVRAGKETVKKEITGAGFEFIEEVDVEGLEENYFIRFRKPVQ